MHSVAKIVLACCCATAPAGVAAPAIEWASHLAGANFQLAGIVALSPLGNVYFTGQAGTGAVFGTNTWTANTPINWFLAKHSDDGRLLWIQSSSRVFSESLSTAFDAAENFYVAGLFSERAEFGNFVLNGVPTQSHVFLVKFAPNGHVPWARVIAWTDSENSPRLALGPAGDIYLAAAHVVSNPDEPYIDLNRYDAATGTPLWQQSTVISSPHGANLHDLKVDNAGNVYVSGNLDTGVIDTAIYYLAKFDSAGNRLWMLNAHGTDEDDYASELALDHQGFVYIAGEFMTQTQWGTNVLNESDGLGVFLAKVNPLGDVLWARHFHGTLNDFDQDAEGNCYLTGDFSGTNSIGTNILISRGSSDLFLARFDRDGTPLWVRQVGDAGWDHSPAVSLDERGNVYLSGPFFSPLDFGPQQLTSRGMSDIFIARYNRHGHFYWAQQFGGPDYDDLGTSNERPDSDWAIDAAGNIYFTANFWDRTTVGANTFLSAGNTDVFFAKLAADPPETLRFLPPGLNRINVELIDLRLIGAQGRTPIHIEASADLKKWSAIYTQAVPSEVISISDPLLPGARFYRAVIP